LNRLLPWIIPVAFAAGWLIIAEMRMLPAYLLPHPIDILDCGYAYVFGSPGDGMYAGRLLSDAGASLVRGGVGFAVAAAFGIPLGVMSGRLPVVDRLLSTSVNGIRAVPGISWLPLALVWFEIGLKTTVFLVALAAFFPIYINSASGVRQANPILLQAGAMMGVRRLRGPFAIFLPSAMPYIISGLR
jgi:NitT/TauT family transport system permease protein